jgi:hypothetical protein
MLLLLILLCFGCPLYYSMQSDGEDEPEEAEDLASSADLSFDEIRSVLNKPEKQVRLQPNPAASPRCAWQHCRRPGLGLEECHLQARAGAGACTRAQAFGCVCHADSRTNAAGGSH